MRGDCSNNHYARLRRATHTAAPRGDSAIAGNRSRLHNPKQLWHGNRPARQFRGCRSTRNGPGALYRAISAPNPVTAATSKSSCRRVITSRTNSTTAPRQPPPGSAGCPSAKALPAVPASFRATSSRAATAILRLWFSRAQTSCITGTTIAIWRSLGSAGRQTASPQLAVEQLSKATLNPEDTAIFEVIVQEGDHVSHYSHDNANPGGPVAIRRRYFWFWRDGGAVSYSKHLRRQHRAR